MFGLSMNEKIANKLKKTNYISERNVSSETFDRLMSLRETIAKSSGKYLNRKNISGIWYLTDKHFDENRFPQLIIRSSVKAGTNERIMLDHEVSVMAENENAYDFDADILNENLFIEGLTNSLRSDILNGKIFAVYDSNRECI